MCYSLVLTRLRATNSRVSLIQLQIEKGKLIVKAYQRSSDANLGYLLMLQNGQSKYIAVDGQTGEIIKEGITKINMK
jgi:hypothetical protein